MWKIPGGLIDDNEYISQAVEREVEYQFFKDNMKLGI